MTRLDHGSDVTFPENQVRAFPCSQGRDIHYGPGQVVGPESPGSGTALTIELRRGVRQ